MSFRVRAPAPHGVQLKPAAWYGAAPVRYVLAGQRSSLGGGLLAAKIMLLAAP